MHCLTIWDKTTDDVRFRPGTPRPDSHWAFRFLDSLTRWDKHFVGKMPASGQTPEGIRIAQRGESYVIEVDSIFAEHYGLCQLMDMVKGYGMTYTFESGMEPCDGCVRSECCVYHDHAVGDQ